MNNMGAFKVIIGLGNPGKKYSITKHNLGFMVLDAFADNRSMKWKNYKESAIISVGESIVLIKPLLFMNNSGSAIAPLVKKYLPRCQVDDIDFSDIIVVHDDMDIGFGQLRIKKGGSSGGHNGVQSIIDTLGTNEFSRVRMGIGRPSSDTDPVDFVLSNFTNEELIKMKSVILTASDAVSVLIEKGIHKAMNLFNVR